MQAIKVAKSEPPSLMAPYSYLGNPLADHLGHAGIRGESRRPQREDKSHLARRLLDTIARKKARSR